MPTSTTVSAFLLPTIPYVRDYQAIQADLAPAIASSTADASRSLMAEIELHIRNGDGYYAQAQYDQAINEYTTARGLIYRLLYPSFDVNGLLRQRTATLPVSKDLETSLLNVSATIMATLRPQADPAASSFPVAAAPIPRELQQFSQIGFQKPEDFGQTLQRAGQQSALLLLDQNPAAALEVLKPGLSQLASGSKADPSVAGAVELNAATADLQNGDSAGAAKFADQALQSFTAANDVPGQAQALHAKAVALSRMGQAQAASALLDQAAKLIGGSPPPPIVHIGTAGAAALQPVSLRPAPMVSPALSLRSASVGAAMLPVGQLSRAPNDLKPITNKDLGSLTVRAPGAIGGWAVVPSQAAVPKDAVPDWQVGVPAGSGTAIFKISATTAITGTDVATSLYTPRASAAVSGLLWGMVDTASTALYLPHLYAYALPVKLGDAYHAYGAYAQAEALYLQASQYSYLNGQNEGVALWIRLGRNTLDWGDSYYKSEDVTSAKAQYGKIVTPDTTTVPTSALYTTAPLATAAASAKTLIGGINQRPLPTIDRTMSNIILMARCRQQQIFNGVDYYGLAFSPIFTFEYLQSVARGFAQEAITAERDFIDFKSRQEAGEQTRRDLVSASAMASAQADASYQEYQSALDDQSAAQQAVSLSRKRHDDADTELNGPNGYRVAGPAQTWAQAAGQALGAGEDAMYGDISQLADQLDSGQTITAEHGKVAAAETLSAGRKTQAYEIQKMQDNIDELNANIGIAQAQSDSATAKANAAEIAHQAAQQKAAFANDALNAFDNNFFTPEVWGLMADFMRGLAERYLDEATRVAKLMERAYNFENDTNLHTIRQEYGISAGNPAAGQDTRLRGGDSLLSDIESFTYIAVTTKMRKRSRIKDLISVSIDFPAQFDVFRQTGTLTIETDLYEFDRLHPGYYAQRIEGVEVELVGLLPEGGLNGTLEGGGVTSFRRADGTKGTRVHEVDVMSLSNFVVRNDAFLYSSETGVRGLFEGFGLGSTWKLRLPRRSNDFDMRRIFDVHLILYYTALYDPALEAKVLSAPARPGENELMRTYSLRYDFADAWYGMYRNGVVQLRMDRYRLPYNQQNFKTTFGVLRVSTTGGVSPAGITVKITRPDGVSAQGATDANGLISTDAAPLNALNGSDPLGTWKLEVLDGASLKDNTGQLVLGRLFNIQFGLQYSFDYLPEVA
jgi:hypothetical protein